MNSTIIKTFLVALIATFTLPSTQRSADAQETKSAGLVAVLDVAKVFKEHQGFDTKMKAIKSEAEGLKTQIQQQMDAIKVEAQSLNNYEPGSNDRNQLEATLEQKQAALRTKARQAEADLLNREAGIYYETYQEMQKVVSGLAGQHGISLVLRFESGPIDPSNRPEVIKGVNRPVVFHRRLDLTNMVITQMNPSTAAAPNGTQNK